MSTYNVKSGAVVPVYFARALEAVSTLMVVPATKARAGGVRNVLQGVAS